ncbi:unnamed protein product [Caenorhabditis brenneri]
MRYGFIFFSCLLILLPVDCIAKRINQDFDYELSRRALEFAAAAYSLDPEPCVVKNNATVLYANKVECDYMRDECWSVIAADNESIFVGFSGTKSKEQLVTELVESIGRPKHKLHNAGSVHYYFYSALKTMWSPMEKLLEELKEAMPNHRIVFTGHSLGGAIASIASTVFVRNFPETSQRTLSITFGQPRVGNQEYAATHDRLVAAGSWRLIHGRDIVAHIPICVEGYGRSCIPFYNHGSYHHGVEIWFPGNMTNRDTFKVCTGIPLNEDNSCSNAHRYFDITDHLFYFGHHVSDYGVNKCIDPINKPVHI